MSTTLNNIVLPDDLLWADEFDWSPVQTSAEYAITGAIVVDTAQRLAGRPITLTADDDRAWITRATLVSLYALTAIPGQTMTLDRHGTSYSVIWRPGAEPIDARPIWPIVPHAGLHYVVTLRLTEI